MRQSPLANRQSVNLQSAVCSLQSAMTLLPNGPRLRPRDEGLRKCSRRSLDRVPCGLVDGNEDDVAGSLKLGRVLAVADVALEDVDPNREGGFGTGHALAERLLLVVAHPHAE